MRRLACALAAFLLLAPAGLRLAASGFDSEALRCAIACGHAAKAGAACCPMADAAPRGLAMASCPRGDSPTAASMSASQPAVLLAVRALALPEGCSPHFAFALRVPRGPAALPPDHVPLLLS